MILKQSKVEIIFILENLTNSAPIVSLRDINVIIETYVSEHIQIINQHFNQLISEILIYFNRHLEIFQEIINKCKGSFFI